MKALVLVESTSWVSYRSSPKILPLLNPGTLLGIGEGTSEVPEPGIPYQWSRSSWGPFGDEVRPSKSSGKEEVLGQVGIQERAV